MGEIPRSICERRDHSGMSIQGGKKHVIVGESDGVLDVVLVSSCLSVSLSVSLLALSELTLQPHILAPQIAAPNTYVGSPYWYLALCCRFS